MGEGSVNEVEIACLLRDPLIRLVMDSDGVTEIRTIGCQGMLTVDDEGPACRQTIGPVVQKGRERSRSNGHPSEALGATGAEPKR
jgi:hypothetical protein